VQTEKHATVKLNIPAGILHAVGLRQTELHQEVLERPALSFYADRTLSFGQAARLAGLDYWAFSDLLARKKTLYHYDVEDLENDLENAKELGLL
jgi:predicted HTH domain antitoxin